jgi:glycosyltransferase involved in cell wall biosynthesis
LDPYVIEHVERLCGLDRAVFLADPVKTQPDDERCGRDLRASLDVGRDRKAFLLFGSLAWRKGILQLLDALSLLSREALERICLMLVGQIRVQDEETLEMRIAQVRESLPLRVLRQHEFLPERSVQSYFHAADAVLAPYQRHTGMSGVMVRAAAAGKPILAPNYGLVGEIVHRRRLGLTVDTTQPAQIARGLEELLAGPTDALFDRQSALRYGQEHTPERFAGTLFDRLMCP